MEPLQDDHGDGSIGGHTPVPSDCSRRTIEDTRGRCLPRLHMPASIAERRRDVSQGAKTDYECNRELKNEH
ncbi:MAG: hypothetical protein CV090_04410 [Nitrospira sp. WS238]|nr:hypothetical protein [Nitrospira sp. WS238]